MASRSNENGNARTPLDFDISEYGVVAVGEPEYMTAVYQISVQHAVSYSKSGEVEIARHEYAYVLPVELFVFCSRELDAGAAVFVGHFFADDFVVGFDNIVGHSVLVAGVGSPEMLPSGYGEFIGNADVICVMNIVYRCNSAGAVYGIVGAEDETFKRQTFAERADKGVVVLLGIVAGSEMSIQRGVVSAQRQIFLARHVYLMPDKVAAFGQSEHGVVGGGRYNLGKRGGNVLSVFLQERCVNDDVLHGFLLLVEELLMKV